MPRSTGTMRFAVQAVSAIHQSTVPWCTVIVRNAFGVGGGAHQPAEPATSFRYAWPSGNWGSLPLEGGVEAAYRAEIDAADDPQGQAGRNRDAARALRSPFRTAEYFNVEEDHRSARHPVAAVRVRLDPALTQDGSG
jgi:acetyl-CoA carboxylase carboxyltransferase component